MLQIWLGDSPVGSKLKEKLLPAGNSRAHASRIISHNNTADLPANSAILLVDSLPLIPYPWPFFAVGFHRPSF
jgi:hypothetical protein